METLKVITGIGETLSGKLLLYNGLSQSMQKINFHKQEANLQLQGLADSYEFDCAVEMPSVAPEALEELLKEDNCSLIDVRTFEEFEEYHLPRSINLPLEELADRREEIRPESNNYFICQSGMRSRKAIALLQKYYPEAKLFNVKGGLNNYEVYVAKY